MLKKKIKVVTPESKIQGADIHVEAQQAHFIKMKEEVEYAIGQRAEAITELDKEVASLEAQLRNKKALIEQARDKNTADMAFKAQIDRLLGN